MTQNTVLDNNKFLKNLIGAKNNNMEIFLRSSLNWETPTNDNQICKFSSYFNMVFCLH